MSTPRLGAASVNVSISDKEGFRVIHGQDGTVLLVVSQFGKSP